MNLHIILPNDIDDPTRPSGGNHYDRRLCRGLPVWGWVVREHAVPGDWPAADAGARAELGTVLSGLPDGDLVVVDGLIGSAVPEILAPHADRLRLVILVHMPFGDTGDRSGPAWVREAQALATAVLVVTTSEWCRSRLLELYDLAPDRVQVAAPGVDASRLVTGSPAGTRLLCVAAVTHSKGHDVLVRALARLTDVPWTCVCVGALDRAPGFVDHLRQLGREQGIAERVRFAGPHAYRELERFYAAADLLVLPSRGETYGMVVTEALAHGIPVLATSVGGLPGALGHAPDGSRPGLLVPPDDVAAFAGALRRWLEDPTLRARLRRSAQGRRSTQVRWASPAEAFAAALNRAAPTVRIHTGR